MNQQFSVLNIHCKFYNDKFVMSEEMYRLYYTIHHNMVWYIYYMHCTYNSPNSMVDQQKATQPTKPHIYITKSLLIYSEMGMFY